MALSGVSPINLTTWWQTIDPMQALAPAMPLFNSVPRIGASAGFVFANLLVRSHWHQGLMEAPVHPLLKKMASPWTFIAAKIVKEVFNFGWFEIATSAATGVATGLAAFHHVSLRTSDHRINKVGTFLFSLVLGGMVAQAAHDLNYHQLFSSPKENRAHKQVINSLKSLEEKVVLEQEGIRKCWKSLKDNVFPIEKDAIWRTSDEREFRTERRDERNWKWKIRSDAIIGCIDDIKLWNENDKEYWIVITEEELDRAKNCCKDQEVKRDHWMKTKYYDQKNEHLVFDRFYKKIAESSWSKPLADEFEYWRQRQNEKVLKARLIIPKGESFQNWRDEQLSEVQIESFANEMYQWWEALYEKWVEMERVHKNSVPAIEAFEKMHEQGCSDDSEEPMERDEFFPNGERIIDLPRRYYNHDEAKEAVKSYLENDSSKNEFYLRRKREYDNWVAFRQKVAEQKELSPEEVATFEKAVGWRCCSEAFGKIDADMDKLVEYWHKDYRCWNLRKQYDNLVHFEEDEPEDEKLEDVKFQKIDEMLVKMSLEGCRR